VTKQTAKESKVSLLKASKEKVLRKDELDVAMHEPEVE
jgi:hypothetical protein